VGDRRRRPRDADAVREALVISRVGFSRPLRPAVARDGALRVFALTLNRRWVERVEARRKLARDEDAHEPLGAAQAVRFRHVAEGQKGVDRVGRQLVRVAVDAVSVEDGRRGEGKRERERERKEERKKERVCRDVSAAPYCCAARAHGAMKHEAWPSGRDAAARHGQKEAAGGGAERAGSDARVHQLLDRIVRKRSVVAHRNRVDAERGEVRAGEPRRSTPAVRLLALRRRRCNDASFFVADGEE